MGKQHFERPQPWVTTEHHHFMNGTLWSGDEHRQLCHKPCQIQTKVKGPTSSTQKTFQKTTQEDLKDENSSPKLLCIMLTLRTWTDALFTSSRSTMLSANTIVLKVHFILHHWRIPIGRNKLSKAVSNMCKECEIQGFRTNHSLRATAATRLYASGVDKQLVMEQTGHWSIEGIRSYKRTSSEQQQAVSDILTNTKKYCSDVAIPQLTTATTDIAEVGNSTTQLSTSNTANICLPSFLASKTGTFHFNSCNNVNINFNCNPNK